MKVEDITICPEPACPVCALERKVVETIKPHIAQPGGEVSAEKCVALAHAMARVIYDSSKDPELQAERITWLAEITAKAVYRLARNDRSEH